MQGGGSFGDIINNRMSSSSLIITSPEQKRIGNSNSTGFTSVSSPSSYNEESNLSATENRLYLARLTLEYQELLDRYGLCINQLQDTANQAELLRQQNEKLRVANKDLTKRLAILTQASIQTRYVSAGLPSLSIINDFRSLCLGDNGRGNGGNSGNGGDGRVQASEVAETSPTSVIGNNRFEKKSTERVTLPKSISIRSSGYLKMNQSGGTGSSSISGGANIINRPLALSPVTNDLKLEQQKQEQQLLQQQQQQQRVCVPVSSSKEEGPLEFDVFNQGMFKTELCNKWQETGACPYGDQCQFAHGIGELRPVIRHPRYKTEVCRMVLSGDNCPYGHRCHFRHALTEQERLTRRA